MGLGPLVCIKCEVIMVDCVCLKCGNEFSDDAHATHLYLLSESKQDQISEKHTWEILHGGWQCTGLKEDKK